MKYFKIEEDQENKWDQTCGDDSAPVNVISEMEWFSLRNRQKMLVMYKKTTEKREEIFFIDDMEITKLLYLITIEQL